MDRADIVHEAFLARVSAGEFPSGDAPSALCLSFEAVAIFRAQCLSRNLDRRSRKMQSAGQGFYTIGSSGHEGMAALPPHYGPMIWRFCIIGMGRFKRVVLQWCLEQRLLGICCSASPPQNRILCLADVIRYLDPRL